MREQIKKIIKRFSKELILALILAVVAAYAIEIAKEKTKDEILNEARKASATVITYDKNGDPLNEGSGFFISSNGILVTAFHVIEGARDIIAKLPSGAYYDAEKILGARKDIDIAIIQFKAQDTPFVRLGNQNKIKIGQKVYAIGTPGGLEGTISEGIISNPSLKLNDLVFIQHTAPISPGSSGGPLLEDHGRVIGINTKSLKLSYQEGVAQNLNFAVPVNYIKEAIEGKGKLAEGSPDYFYSLGILAENKKDYDKAEEYFKKAISLDKKYTDAYIELGGIYYDKGSYDLEIEMFKKAVELDPSNIDAHYSLATAYEDKEKYDLAIKEYEKVLELKPDDKDTMYSLGILYLIKNEKEKAFELVNKLERLDPGLGKELKILIDKMK